MRHSEGHFFDLIVTRAPIQKANWLQFAASTSIYPAHRALLQVQSAEKAYTCAQLTRCYLGARRFFPVRTVALVVGCRTFTPPLFSAGRSEIRSAKRNEFSTTNKKKNSLLYTRKKTPETFDHLNFVFDSNLQLARRFAVRFPTTPEIEI